ncbi:MAG: T9SS type A sorting domain-containing protein [Ignavibacteriales bacterium]|nr:MAG: T9SS type A sorting domain-containing protein [Ignavibacteriales bacterium]
MLKLNAILTLSFLVLISITNAQWLDKSGNLPTTAGNGWAMDAVDSIYSVVSTNAGLFITTNGGSTWDLSATPGFAVDVSMKSISKIWIGDDAGKIHYTNNRGIDWVIQYDDPTKTNFINYIEMFDADNGIAMGDALNGTGAAVILKTTNGGSTWVSMNDSAFGGYSGDIWRRLDFIDLNTGYFYESGINPQKLFKTNNSCQTWSQQALSGPIGNVKFYSENIGLVVRIAVNPNVYRTLDGGVQWEPLHFSSLVYIQDIEFLPGEPSKVWIADDNKLYFSSDTGRTWGEEIVPNITDLSPRDLVFIDGYCGWLLCDGGKVYRTTNGNSITSIKTPSVLVDDYSLKQNYPNPFNPTTKIQFSLREKQNVTLKIYNILGKEIVTVLNEERNAGEHEINFDGSSLPSGIYFYKIQAGDFVVTKKMTLIK